MTATNDIVQKLWNLCHILRDDGITYLQYVAELTYLLFLKMMQETGNEEQEIASSIIGFIRQASLGDALVPYEQRVDQAMRKILAAGAGHHLSTSGWSGLVSS